jgi:hypothetical protein
MVPVAVLPSESQSQSIASLRGRLAQHRQELHDFQLELQHIHAAGWGFPSDLGRLKDTFRRLQGDLEALRQEYQGLHTTKPTETAML